MAKKMAVKQVEETTAEETQEQEPKTSNVKKLVKKETPAPAPAKETKAKKEKAAPKEEDPNQVSLKEICDEHDLNPTTARVKLRRKFGAEGKRYTWERDSDELAAVIELLTTKAEPAEKKEKAETKPAAKKTSKKKAAPEPEVVDDVDEEGGDDEGDEVDPE